MNIILGEGAVKLSLEQWLNWGTENTSVTCLRLEAKSSTNWGAHSLVQLTLNVSMGQALSPVASCTYFYSIEGVVEEWEKKRHGYLDVVEPSFIDGSVNTFLPRGVQPKTWGGVAEWEAGRGAAICALNWVPAALPETETSEKVICPSCHLLPCHPPVWFYNSNHCSGDTAAALLHRASLAPVLGLKGWAPRVGTEGLGIQCECSQQGPPGLRKRQVPGINIYFLTSWC